MVRESKLALAETLVLKSARPDPAVCEDYRGAAYHDHLVRLFAGAAALSNPAETCCPARSLLLTMVVISSYTASLASFLTLTNTGIQATDLRTFVVSAGDTSVLTLQQKLSWAMTGRTCLQGQPLGVTSIYAPFVEGAYNLSTSQFTSISTADLVSGARWIGGCLKLSRHGLCPYSLSPPDTPAPALLAAERHRCLCSFEEWDIQGCG
jgi:hypothetical protein